MCQELSIHYLSLTLKITLNTGIMFPIIQRENWGLEKLNDQTTQLINGECQFTSKFCIQVFFLVHKKTVPSGKAVLGMRYADMGKAKEHTTRFLEKVRANIVAISSTRKGQELGSCVTLSEEIEPNQDIKKNFLWQFLLVLRVKRSSKLNMFHLNQTAPFHIKGEYGKIHILESVSLSK